MDTETHRFTRDWLRSIAVAAFLGACLGVVFASPAVSLAADEAPPAGEAKDDLDQLAEELDDAEAKEPCESEAEEPAKPAEDYATRRKRQAREQRERLLEDPQWKPTHEKVNRLEVTQGLNNFCLDSKGRILACCNDKTIRVLTQEGEQVDQWEIGFSPQAVGVSKRDGVIYVGGEGKIAKLASDGTQILTKEFPAPMTEEELEELVQEQIETQKKRYDETVGGVERQLAELEKEHAGEKQDDEDEGDDKNGEDESPQVDVSRYFAGMTATEDGYRIQFRTNTTTEQQIEAVRMYVKLLRESYGNLEKQEEQIRKRIEHSSRTATYTGVAVADNELFVVCSAPGYSYCAWRMSHDVEEPKRIVKGLRGCCGQMDCQTDGDDLWIPVNGEHLVYRYDRDGNVLNSFGKRDREGADGFGGCCEPKNMRIGEDGYVYCAESGPPVSVKRFSPDGEFQNVACLPLYETGCVRASVDLWGDKIFLLSPNEKAIYVFAPKQEG